MRMPNPADRPNEDDAVAIGYGADGDTIAEAMRMPDGTTHFTVVSLDSATPKEPTEEPRND